MADKNQKEPDDEIAQRDAEITRLKRQVSRLQARMERDKAVSASLAAVSAMRSAEKARQEQYMSLLLDNSPNIIIMLDRSGRFAFSSKTFLTIAGVEDFAAVANKTFHEVIESHFDTELAAALNAALASSIESGKSVETECKIAVGPDTRIFSARVTPLHTTGGDVASSLVMMHDITEIRRAQFSAEEARVTAEEASLAKSTFLSNMSHEMRTPMNAIIGMTSIGRGSGDIERKDYCFGKIEDASTHLLGVINDILDISKIEARKFELSPTEFDFERMLRKVVNVINFRVEEKNQVFDVRIDERIPHTVVGDDQRIAQVITNLLSNAVKFTPEEGLIRLNSELVSTTDDECLIRISVTDTGIGVTDEQKSRLFSSFEQADSSTARKFGGTGLGLAISKNIVEMMGGSIRVDSEPGIGSTFTFTARLGIAEGGIKRRSLLAPGVNFANLKVLVVDDSADVLDYFVDISRRLGFQCDAAIGGKEALSLMDMRGGYDIYFVDWKMPDMDGIELSRRINTREIGTSVVVMFSGVEWSLVEEQAKGVGVQKFLSKPLFPSSIEDIINDCLGIEGEVKLPDDETSAGIFHGKRVLFAEDVEVNREILIALMEPTEIDLVVAENGVEAVEKFKAEPTSYDMILMDMQMPEMDGCDATREIRALGTKWAKNIPIVAMTANVFREDVERCLAAGMNDHIGKPIDIGEVMSKLRHYLPWADKVKK
jgi:PAS domain S-box-containing protein